MRKMKDSGIEWIGEIPEDWEVKKLNYCFNMIGSGTTPKSERDDYYNGDIHWLQSGDIHGMYITNTEKYINQNALNDFSALKVYKAPFIVIAMYGASIANTSIVKIDCCTNQACCVLSNLKNDISENYAYYSVITAKSELLLLSRGGTQPNISQDIIKQLRIPFPPLSEQQQIADYLDKKVSEIDSTISKTRESIEEYKKLKQSIITEAVTKGLNPNAKMKDSGIEWIGEIPEGWEVWKTLYTLKMPITDGPHETPELLPDGIPFISAEAVSCGNGHIDFSHKRGYISREYYNECCKKYVPQLDDIYMIKSGATTGKIAKVETTEIFTIWSPLAVFRFDEHIANVNYMYFYLQSDCYQKQIEDKWTYGTQQNIGMRTLEQLKLVVPPLSEQQQISDFLDQKCSEIDALITKKEQLVVELEAYKKALIYEVVTGKREV